MRRRSIPKGSRATATGALEFRSGSSHSDLHLVQLPLLTESGLPGKDRAAICLLTRWQSTSRLPGNEVVT